MASALEHIRYAYFAMEEEVLRALRTQVGDPVQLLAQRNRVLQLMTVAEQVRTCELFSSSTRNVDIA
jgi:hypothetical protein